MFVVDEPTAAAIRKAYLESGELSAVVELRRRFPGIVDNENARLCVRTIASWQPLPPLPPRSRRHARPNPRRGDGQRQCIHPIGVTHYPIEPAFRDICECAAAMLSSFR